MTRLTIPRDSRWFVGHFDGFPILPGVAHIGLAVEVCGRGRMLQAVRNVRFHAALVPGDDVEVNASEGESPDVSRFEIVCRGTVVSSGVLVFAS